MRLVVVLFALLFATSAEAGVTRAEANRTTGHLVLWDGDTQVASFHAAFGSFVAPKQREGDRATPVGRYMLTPARASRSWRWFMPIDYPNADDRAAGRTGFDVGVHGLGGNPFLHMLHWLGVNWTAGCIAVTNAEMETLRSLITTPVPIEITF